MTFKRLRKALQPRFVRDESGVSAVEFALLLPMMMSFYLGSVEVSQGVSTNSRLTLTARSLGDLVTQSTNITNAQMTDILNASSTIISPYSTSPLKIIVSAVSIDGSGNAKVTWSDSRNTTARTVGSSVTLPSSLARPNTMVVWSETKYDYTPTIGYVITGTLHLQAEFYSTPRQSATVTRSAS